MSHALSTDGIPSILILMHLVGSQRADVFDDGRISDFLGRKGNYTIRFGDVVEVDDRPFLTPDTIGFSS